ncbi:MAG: glycosyltransferase family 2 protein [Bacteroidota bacterium]
MKHPAPDINVLIAVPALNEERNIPSLLKRLEPWKMDVLVIDDGSTDNTPEMVRRMGYSCFSRESNLGLSAFYRTAREHGLTHGYTHLITIDADLQHDPEYIPAFISALGKYDLVSGDRFHHTLGIPAAKIASNMFARMLFKEYLGLSFPDVACGFRALKLTSFGDHPGIDGFGIIYDMLLKHALSGKSTGFVSIPATYYEDQPLNTKCSELSGLLTVINNYRPSQSVHSVMEAVINKSSFHLNLQGYDFDALYEEPGAYLFKMKKA